jgi:hypothetical protein
MYCTSTFAQAAKEFLKIKAPKRKKIDDQNMEMVVVATTFCLSVSEL